VAERLPSEDGLSTMLARADLALYEAKHAGRNQVREALVPSADRTAIPV
jgi:PleD family two-component response regulator